MTNTAEEHERRERDAEAAFVRRLTQGRNAELQIAARILPLGLWVKVGRLFVADRDASLTRQETQARDEIDIEVEGGHRLEIKARPFRFTSPDDFPFPTAYVGSERRWQSRNHHPCVVVIVSQPTGGLVVAPTCWKSGWTLETPFAQDRGFCDPSLAVPRNLLLPEARLFDHLRQPCPVSQIRHPWASAEDYDLHGDIDA